MKWEKGRQDTGYSKLTIFNILFFDLYILKFPTNSEIPSHVDLANRPHCRLNIVLKKATEGGKFICSKTILNWSRIKLFRPDIHEHSVTKITKGTRWVLSIGWLYGRRHKKRN
jgi:hypothetical protein